MGDFITSSLHALSRAKGKRISSIDFMSRRSSDVDVNKMTILFDCGDSLEIYDNGQQCCERRYMVTNEDMSFFADAEFYGLDVRDVVEGRDEDGESLDSQFMLVSTSKGTFTVANYNQHNGYYGGFDITAVYEMAS